ncbi:MULTISPECIES: XdhC family protein [Streptomyces]|uniref:Xanthine and CO dehydrogenases maturation factor,XdhC or CoxF family n=1 Tax=Streptomyces venezuelae (strain ATCC 10712 / CBS 650.69 / DSM 40230 / JCM 4526 / NBRC 13096 / PD 04745) TaxID=953739 RepID=F2RB23_STRVP|nr:XdhC/CoxI family protein [Streptomyces venezuelae]APE24753.1 XshC-Cox1-family protein [Streptomyces venezuelae]QES02102.1 XdhC/CoxI family protein [Streptomyces venezuelae ATCC 10712]QES09081.1 XdhC/CoxI family protein [Streptomyces venezuelae]CCA59242.1 Xanthine and CO dehydrogenases maturation factor,XdhC or CoxF family [Streptomyces venezuelae ATCC 10712]
MLDIAEELHRWVEQGREFAVATVVAVGGSAPRQPGAALAVDSDGTAIGSVSGGCVEGAVYDLCVQALEDGRTVTERFGYSDEDAFAVGLTCGGIIDILVTPVRGGVFPAALRAAATGEAAALARIVSGPEELMGRALLVRPDGSYEGKLGGHPELDRTAASEARALLDAGRTGTVEIGEDGSRCGQPLTLLVESSVPAPRMIVFGAIDFAAALVRVGKFLGYHVTVCDARPVFATPARFPEADDIVVEWPHRYLESTEVDGRTVLCVLTHDAKFDVPLLQAALKLPVAYVGAMGSRRTHEDRNKRLREVGVTEIELARLRSPIGLDLGARTPEETALSIGAEIVANRRGGTGLSLTGAHTPIHHDVPREPAGRIGSVA